MKAPIKIDEPIEDLFEKVDEGQELAITGVSPESKPQIIMITESIILATTVYNEEYRVWEANPRMDKTWFNFKKVFRRSRPKAHKILAGHHTARQIPHHT
jgi:hypothetical protein